MTADVASSPTETEVVIIVTAADVASSAIETERDVVKTRVLPSVFDSYGIIFTQKAMHTMFLSS